MLDWPSLAAAIGGPVVGLAAIRFTRREGRENRTLTLALAEREHEHQRAEARAARLFDARRDAYVNALESALGIYDTVTLTEPILTYVGMPDPPPTPKSAQWNRVLAPLDALASDAVQVAADAYWGKARAFFTAVATFRQTRDQLGPGDRTAKALREMGEAREASRIALEALRDAINDELRGL